MHLSTINVNLGDYVDEGTVIGTIGRSGYGKETHYRAHLHYELMINSKHTNPVLDDVNGILIDPHRLNEPIDLGYIEASFVVSDQNLLKLNTRSFRLSPPVSRL